jgi:NTE family protein
MTVAFVLGGGGVRGAVEIGMLRALFERGIRPDLVVGTSAGAINGSWVAAGGDLRDLGALWRGLRRADVFPFGPITGFPGAIGVPNHLVPQSPPRALLSRTPKERCARSIRAASMRRRQSMSHAPASKTYAWPHRN